MVMKIFDERVIASGWKEEKIKETRDEDRGLA